MTWSRWLRRHLLARPARTAIAIVAVTLGVAVYVGVGLGTRAVIDEIRASQAARSSADSVLLEKIGFGGGPVDTEVIDRIGSLAGVRSVLDPLRLAAEEDGASLTGGASVSLVRSTVAVVLEEGVDPAAWVERNAAAIQPLRVVDQDPFGSDSAEFFESIEASLTPLAGAALVVSGFIIHLTMSRTVGDRRTVFGAMRALGASRRTVVGSVLAEAAVIGAIGTAGGVLLGHVIGPIVVEGMSTAFGIHVAPGAAASLTPLQWSLAVGGGLLVPPLGAGVPAFRASRVEPATAMRQDRDDASVPVLRGIAGVTAFVAGAAWAFLIAGDAKAIGVLVAMVGLLAGVPLLVAPLVSVLRRCLVLAPPGVGDIAAAQVARRRGRTTVTVGLVTGTLTLVLLVQTVVAGQRPAFVDAVETTLGADVHLSLGDGAADGFDALVAAPGVAAATPVWQGRVDITGRRPSTENLTVIDPATYFDVAGFTWTRGTDGAAAIESLRGGGAVLVSTNVADATGVGRGDRVRLQTVVGPEDFDVAGTYYGFAYGTSDAVVVGLSDGRRAFDVGAPEAALVDIDPGTGPGLQGGDFGGGSTIGSVWGTSVSTWRQQIVAQFDGIFGLVQSIAVLVGLLGLFGLANTLSMEVLDRRYEFGVLRALGLQRGAVLRLVVLEGALLAAVAAVCAVGAGVVLGWAMVDSGAGGVDELANQRRFPGGAALVRGSAAAVVGGAFSLVPGRAAARVSSTELLRSAD